MILICQLLTLEVVTSGLTPLSSLATQLIPVASSIVVTYMAWVGMSL